MADEMQVVELSEQELNETLDLWRKEGVSNSEILQFLDYSEEPRIDCCAVKDEQSKILALFEKRDAVRAYKNMSILLAPEIDVQEGENYAASPGSLKKSLLSLPKFSIIFLKSHWNSVA